MFLLFHVAYKELFTLFSNLRIGRDIITLHSNVFYIHLKLQCVSTLLRPLLQQNFKDLNQLHLCDYYSGPPKTGRMQRVKDLRPRP